MNLFIPPISTKLELEEPWTFTLFAESRNDTFIDNLRAAGYKIPAPKTGHDWYWRTQKLCDFTLPAGTNLSVSRIYIRLGSKEYDSVTFHANFLNDKGKKVKGRFWAKLDEVNKMKVKINEETKEKAV